MSKAKASARTPKVSVISIFYNGQAYLEEALESVLAQDHSDFELLLVDDGSTDRSAAIAEAFRARDPDRVRCLAHPGRVNRGMSATRNLGIGEARGEFVTFIDADDRWRPYKLREQLAIFEDIPAIDALFGAINYWREWDGGEDKEVPSGHRQGRPIAPPEAALAVYPLGRAAAPCPSDLMVRRATALALGGFEESFTGPMQMYEDQAFFSKLYLSATVYFADRCWVDYRLHDRSCVAQVTRSGQYDAVRKSFLSWLAAYAEQAGRASPRVRWALLRARLSSSALSPRRLGRPIVERGRRLFDKLSAG